MKALAILENVSMRYGGAEVISGFSLRIKRGDVIGLYGPSGAGKSTLLGIIAGLVKPAGGRVVNRAKAMGYAFQEHRLLPWRSIEDNLILALRACGWKRPLARERARAILHKVELGGFENSYPSQLSGGMLQRASLARAVSINPDLLILDEPFNALDQALSMRMQGMLTSMIKSANTAVVMASHSKADLAGIVNRRIELKGRPRPPGAEQAGHSPQPPRPRPARAVG